nr:MAG TPA: hypothetical protein [Caudoviricetes sp.]
MQRSVISHEAAGIHRLGAAAVCAAAGAVEGRDRGLSGRGAAAGRIAGIRLHRRGADPYRPADSQPGP